MNKRNSKGKESLVNHVQWNITRKCNYNCSYCLTKNKRLNECWGKITADPDPCTFLDKFRKHLSGSWQFYLCGAGEPFATPRFLEIVKELAKMNHQVGVQTNFSMPEEKIVEFCKITRDKLFQFKASLHLEYVSLEIFLEKALKVRNLIGDKFAVCSVARKGRVAELEKIGQIFRKKGIIFILQLERDYTKKNIKEPFVNYTEKEKNIIKNFKRRLYDKNIPKFTNNLCWAGSKYFVIDEKGEAYRCNPAQRLKDSSGYLGNLLDDTFRLKKNPSVCSYKYCYCTQPIRLGLILNQKNK